jgi:hypothetical protein
VKASIHGDEQLTFEEKIMIISQNPEVSWSETKEMFRQYAKHIKQVESLQGIIQSELKPEGKAEEEKEKKKYYF